MQILGARACAEHKHRNHAQAHHARLLAQKAAHLLNNAFMRVVGLPPTYGSTPKSI